MNAVPGSAGDPINFCFADPVGFSGQKAATELVIHGLAQRGWTCRRLPQPVLDRGRGGGWPRARYAVQVLAAWARSVRLMLAPGNWLFLSMGQTRASFLRDAVPLLLGRAGLGRARIVILLNGGVFMRWTDRSMETRVFRFLLGCAGAVTVVGERQRARLIEIGLPANRVIVRPNSCDLEPVGADAVATKHAMARPPEYPMRCLYLSSLIDTKGFPEYLEALHQLSKSAGINLDAVLCGRLVPSEFAGRFPDSGTAERWIETEMAAINRSGRVRVRWVKGATGVEKAALFRNADVFVLPTRYAVEAQPLVLLEAMASGCAIITTPIAEIPTILDEGCAIFLPEVSVGALGAALQSLAAQPSGRLRLAAAAHARFMERFRVERHLDHWEQLLNRTADRPGEGA